MLSNPLEPATIFSCDIKEFFTCENPAAQRHQSIPPSSKPRACDGHQGECRSQGFPPAHPSFSAFFPHLPFPDILNEALPHLHQPSLNEAPTEVTTSQSSVVSLPDDTNHASTFLVTGRGLETKASQHHRHSFPSTTQTRRVSYKIVSTVRQALWEARMHCPSQLLKMLCKEQRLERKGPSQPQAGAKFAVISELVT